MQTPPPLRSGHLDIKDAQCAKKNYARKISYHIISRLGAAGVLGARNSNFFKSGHIYRVEAKMALVMTGSDILSNIYIAVYLMVL